MPARHARHCLLAAACCLAAALAAPAPAPADPLLAVSNAFRQVAERMRPSVVVIETTYKVLRSSPLPDPDGADGRAEGIVQKGEGTGVVFDDKGHVVTSNHVIEGADEVKVILADSREFKARIVGRDPKTDLALLRIEAAPRPAECGDSDAVQVGDWAIAIGNALGFKQTVTVGIISAKGRNGLRAEEDAYEDFLQTDAAINRGNSGGPLCGIDGRMIGINAMIASNTGGSQGLGFAIPINMVKNVVGQLVASGRVTRGFLGVGIEDLTAVLARQLGYDGSEGAVFTDVTEEGPAEKAGIQVGDIVFAADGRPVKDSLALRNAVAQKKPGEAMTLDICRKARKMKVQVAIGSMEEGSSGDDDSLGLSVAKARKSDLREMRAQNGVVITDVIPGSPAEKAGLQPGLLIQSVDQMPVDNPRDFLGKVAVSLAEADKEVLLYVRSEKNSYFLVLTRE